jgi:hypothetical protein
MENKESRVHPSYEAAVQRHLQAAQLLLIARAAVEVKDDARSPPPTLTANKCGTNMTSLLQTASVSLGAIYIRTNTILYYYIIVLSILDIISRSKLGLNRDHDNHDIRPIAKSGA